jgi:hypothetical protein
MPDRIIRALSKGGPLSRVWIAFFAIGATGCGLLSIPATGSAVVLVPLFLVAGVLCMFGCFTPHKPKADRHPLLRGRARIMSGLALMSMAAWCRSVILWGLDQRGAGASILATFVWCWIAIGCVMLMVSVWARGVE